MNFFLDTGKSFDHHTPPMPLKHFTETFLIVVLGVAIVLTGLLTATLPSLPAGTVPWGILFVLSVVYPLVLNPLFQQRRADNLFRLLHWFPAAILIVWLVLQGVAISNQTSAERVPLTWAWTLVPVLVGFFFLIAYCLKVIRRRKPRLILLALILIPFTAAALISEKGAHVERELAQVLWSGDFWQGDLFASLRNIGQNDGGVNLKESEDEEEESWRERLRIQKRREERIAARADKKKSVAMHGEEDTSSAMALIRKSKEKQESDKVLSGTGEELRTVSTKPDMLPDSGFGWGMIASLFFVGYCATLHRRVLARIEN